MENNANEKELKSFEIRILFGCVIAAVLAFIGFLQSSLPQEERGWKAMLILLIALLIFVLRKPIARFAVAEERFWDVSLPAKWKKWRDKYNRS